MRPLLVIILAYLIGSVPFGYLIVRLTGGGDVRQTGSGGTGATNVSRRAGKAAGILTLILDFLKGALGILLVARLLDGRMTYQAADYVITAASVAIIVGHIFPVWLGFRGGKGVATGAGIVFTIVPLVALVAVVIFVVVVALTRYVSLASITAVVTLPLLVWLEHRLYQPVLGVQSVLITTVLAALLIIFAHRENIRRLLRGTEPKFR